jgi:hypothetical protein
MIIRLFSVSDQMGLEGFHEAFQAVLGWSGDLGYIVRIHGHEHNGFPARRRRTRRQPRLSDFRLRRQEKFFYACDLMDMWEWDMRVVDIQEGLVGDEAVVCLGGRGAVPPQYCGGPRGYRLMLKRQRDGDAASDPVQMEMAIQWLASTQEEPTGGWDYLRKVLAEGWDSVDRRLEEYGPLEPGRFSLKEANERVARLDRHVAARP